MKSERKIIGRYESVLEAQGALSVLESVGIHGLIDNEFVSGVLPFATQSMGGVTVSVFTDDEAAARAALGESAHVESLSALESGSTISLSSQTRKIVKRASFAAFLGVSCIPVIANLYSLVLFRRAFRMSAETFWEKPVLIWSGFFFNVLGVFVIPILMAGIYFAR